MRLARREKYLVSLGFCALVVFVAVQFVVFPFLDGKARLVKTVAAKERNLKEMRTLSAEYMSRKQDSQDLTRTIQKRSKGFTLFSYLERAATAVAVKDNIKYMKPSTSQGTGPYKELLVEMKLEAITLAQLVDYLYAVESPENLISIKRLSVKENKKADGYMDAVLQVATYQ